MSRDTAVVAVYSSLFCNKGYEVNGLGSQMQRRFASSEEEVRANFEKGISVRNDEVIVNFCKLHSRTLI